MSAPGPSAQPGTAVPASTPLNTTMVSSNTAGTKPNDIAAAAAAAGPAVGPGLPGVTIAQPPKQHAGGPNVVGVHYKVGKKIGEGSFGIIYEGALELVELSSILGHGPDHREKRVSFSSSADLRSLVTQTGVNLLNNGPVAIKFEPRKSEAPQLRDEYRTYKLLAGCGGKQRVAARHQPSI